MIMRRRGDTSSPPPIAVLCSASLLCWLEVVGSAVVVVGDGVAADVQLCQGNLPQHAVAASSERRDVQVAEAGADRAVVSARHNCASLGLVHDEPSGVTVLEYEHSNMLPTTPRDEH